MTNNLIYVLGISQGIRNPNLKYIYAYILLNEEDTRFAKIDKKLFCKYEIEYNKCLTLVGADDDNENIIIIYAEAGDK